MLSEKKINNGEKNLNNQKSPQQLSSLAPERWRLQIPGQKQNNYKIRKKKIRNGRVEAKDQELEVIPSYIKSGASLGDMSPLRRER